MNTKTTTTTTVYTHTCGRCGLEHLTSVANRRPMRGGCPRCDCTLIVKRTIRDAHPDTVETAARNDARG